MSTYQSKLLSLKQSRGGRISSPALRETLSFNTDEEGLDQSVQRYDLLLLVKRVGKQAGFTPRMIALLDYYIAFTRECDWTCGQSPIVYQSLSKTALDMGVSERQIQRLEQDLFKAGALTWRDTGNHRRYGKRDETGHIAYAYGVDLSPLATLAPVLQAKLDEKRLYDKAWMETKRQISYWRGQIRAVMGEMEFLIDEEEGDYTDTLAQLEQDYAPLAIQIRTHIPLQKLREMLAAHKSLHSAALQSIEQGRVVDENAAPVAQQKPKTLSPKNDSCDAHKDSTIKKQSNKLDTGCRAGAQGLQGGDAEYAALQNKTQQQTPPQQKIVQNIQPNAAPQTSEDEREAFILATGLQHITLKQALNVSSEYFRAYLPLTDRPMTWNDMVEAAYRMKGDLAISQSSWAKACAALDRTGAAICLILTDRARLREDNPVHTTGAYFNGMLNRARDGKLNLHKSVYGILERKDYA